jgi:hypothetical protein
LQAAPAQTRADRRVTLRNGGSDLPTTATDWSTSGSGYDVLRREMSGLHPMPR